MYMRRYKDSDQWEVVTEAEVRKRLDGYYYDIDLAIDNLKSGLTLDTPFALFQWVEV